MQAWFQMAPRANTRRERLAVALSPGRKGTPPPFGQNVEQPSHSSLGWREEGLGPPDCGSG